MFTNEGGVLTFNVLFAVYMFHFKFLPLNFKYLKLINVKPHIPNHNPKANL